MTLIPEEMTKELSQRTHENANAFVRLCRDLDTLIKDENKDVLRSGTNAATPTFYCKLALVELFEEQIRHVFEAVREESPHNIGLQLYLANEVSQLRYTLKINTALYMNDLQRRRERIAALKEGILDKAREAEAESERACH